MNGQRNKRLSDDLDYHGRSERQRKVRTIDIDTHEDLDRLTELLLKGLGYVVERRLLPLGDYQWDSRLGRVVIERKTPSDIRDIPRLSGQIERLRQSASVGEVFPLILIDHREDYRRTKAYKPWSDESFDNLLVSCQGKVRVAHCEQGQLAHRLDSLYRWSNKSAHALLEQM